VKRERTDEHAHTWAEDRCESCGLLRREDWVLDEARRPVMVLVWFTPAGRTVRLRQFPYFKGMSPSRPPTATASEAYPGIRDGKEPKCPGRRDRRAPVSA
jgi:hypothetical protein